MTATRFRVFEYGESVKRALKLALVFCVFAVAQAYSYQQYDEALESKFGPIRSKACSSEELLQSVGLHMEECLTASEPVLRECYEELSSVLRGDRHSNTEMSRSELSERREFSSWALAYCVRAKLAFSGSRGSSPSRDSFVGPKTNLSSSKEVLDLLESQIAIHAELKRVFARTDFFAASMLGDGKVRVLKESRDKQSILQPVFPSDHELAKQMVYAQVSDMLRESDGSFKLITEATVLINRDVFLVVIRDNVPETSDLCDLSIAQHVEDQHEFECVLDRIGDSFVTLFWSPY